MISNILKGQQCGDSVAFRSESDIAMILFDNHEVKVTAGRIIPALAMALNGLPLRFLLRGEDASKMEAVWRCVWIMSVSLDWNDFRRPFFSSQSHCVVRSSSGNHDCHDLWLGGCGVPQARHGDRPKISPPRIGSQPHSQSEWGDIAFFLFFSFWEPKYKTSKMG